jgi:hypothetical protein
MNVTELWAGVGGALIAILATISTRLLDHFFKKDYERAQSIWKVRFEKCVELERDAGVLVERLGSWARIDVEQDALWEIIRRFELNAGLVRRDLQLTQAIRDFAQRCKIFVSDKGMFDRPPRERMNEVEDLDSHYRAFLKELNRFVGVVGRERKVG